MRQIRFYIFAFSFLALNGIYAQSKLVEGKKLNITQITSLNNTSEMMGTKMTTIIYDTVNFVVNINSIADSTIKVSCTLLKVKGIFSVMGQEQAFASDDSLTTTNPIMSSILKDLNKPKDFTLINGKIQSLSPVNKLATEISTASGIVADDESVVADLFFPTNIIGRKKGYQWTSEQASDDGNQKAITIFSIDELNATDLKMNSNTSVSAKGTNKMMGYDVKQNLTGSRTTSQNFNVLTGLLSTSTQIINLTGTADVMNMNFPINMKSETKTIVE